MCVCVRVRESDCIYYLDLDSLFRLDIGVPVGASKELAWKKHYKYTVQAL